MLVVTVGGCTAGPAESARYPDTAPPPALTGPSVPSGVPAGPVVEAELPGTAVGVLTAVDVERGTDTDRVIFEFDAETPGYSMRFVPLADVASGGRRVELAGATALVVELTPASGTDNRVSPPIQRYLGPERIPAAPASGTGVVEEVLRTGDADSRLTWAIGLRERVPFTVTTAADPARLVVELAHKD